MSTTPLQKSSATEAPVGPAAGLKKLKAPTATPGAVAVTSLFAIILLAVAGVAIRDFIIHMKWISGTEWIAVASRWIADLSWQVWMWPAGIAMIIIGLFFVWTAVKPRTKTHIEVADARPVDGYAPSTWTRRSDVARRSSAVAREVAGVLEANTVVKRRSVKVRITALDELDRLATEVRSAVEAAVAPVASGLKVKVSTRQKKIAEAVTPPPPAARPALPDVPDEATDDDTPTSVGVGVGSATSEEKK